MAGWQRAGPSARATGPGEPCLHHLFIPREESLFASQLEPGFPVALDPSSPDRSLWLR